MRRLLFPFALVWLLILGALILLTQLAELPTTLLRKGLYRLVADLPGPGWFTYKDSP